MAIVKQVTLVFDDGTAQTINITSVEAAPAAENPVSPEKTEEAGTEVEAVEVAPEA